MPPTSWLVLEGRALSYGKATPYLPLADLLKGYFQIDARDATKQIRENVTGKLLALGKNGKFPASVLPAGKAGPAGPEGSRGAAGPQGIPGLKCARPQGAFYVFPDITGTGYSAKALADRLLEEAGVACLSGTAFGEWGEGHLRFSYSNSLENIQEALRRIKTCLAK